ncbi:MAG TPA: aminotransferase class III-fold pyridoxal phosphate-dependent enzyme [Intrasporangiaceae bacterium]|nr:aminotransferase class III-fold pyridoxal phosphate-dependent enzyme [Intrasporangiaceae bacterium]
MSAPPPEEDVLAAPAPQVSPSTAAAVLADAWAITAADLRDLPSERDRNILVDDRFVLKISNPAERIDLIDLENRALLHARAADPDLPLPDLVRTVAGAETAVVTDDTGRVCRARLITTRPGDPAEGQPITVDLAEQIGAVTARVSLALQGLFHPAADRVIDWDVRRGHHVLDGLDPGLLDLTPTALESLRRRCALAAEATAFLPSGLNHADVTLTNVLSIDGTVTGVIDFGDMHHTANVCDLAVTVTAVIRNTAAIQVATLWELIRAVLTGYQRHRLLQPAEVAVLGDLILSRLALTVAISARRSRTHEANTAYIQQHDATSLRLLTDLLALTPEELTTRLHRIAGTGPLGGPGADLLERRRSVMGGLLSPLFYTRPVEVVRGAGAYLWAADGRRYLDAYNNVAVLGHAHPAVVQAIGRQAAVLNTHSRYLHPLVVDLAERLVATMPEPIDTCLFTTSGTEANDLAWRMASAFTGGTGAITADLAYHGASAWGTDLSPGEWPVGHHPASVATFPSPRGGTAEATGAAAADGVAVAADRLRQAGRRPALLLVDCGFTSAGILDAPTEFMQGLVAGAHEQGALFLADEVQVGFGRIGPPLWRFAAQGVLPDIVTLGKPMGAGYPVGAVLTRREIADALARDYEYFSTFAATPVAAAAGLAVLDTLQESGLPEHAVVSGDVLRSRLREMAVTDTRLGAVRGSGLIAGVDIVGGDGDPDPSLAARIVDGLADSGVLAGRTGPGGTVLKVRPPLVWREPQVDEFVAALTDVLAGLR